MLTPVHTAAATFLQIDPTSALRTKTVRIRWTEERHHEVTVRVVADFDPDYRDIANGLAVLKDDGYQWCTREQIDVEDADTDPDAEFFDPPTYED